MEGKLAGRVALVSGANRGLGQWIAEGLAREGATVAVGARKLPDGEEVAKRIAGAFAVQLDVADDASCRRAVEEVVARAGGLQVLVNNAGVLTDSRDTTETLPLEKLDEMWRVNARGPLVLIQLALPHMRKAGWGRIVNLSTGLSRLSEGMAGRWPGYRMTKTALNALTRNLAAELAGTNIKVNAVDPGWVKTRMGGPGAPRSVEEGADTAIWAASLADDGPSGELLKDRKPTPF